MIIECLNKRCKACGKTLKGRTDKKFCSLNCRNHFNNRLRASDEKLMRMINKTLKRNRDILMNSLTGKKRSKKISLKTLELKGYQFHYFTHQAPDKNGQILRFCYEFGYLTIDQQRVLLVKDPPL